MALDFNISDLDFENVGAWPLPVKIFSCVVLFVILICLAYFFDTKSQLQTLDRKQRKEVELRRVFESKQRLAASLDDYKKQLAMMRDSLGHMLRQLPSSTEVPGLLEDISKSGRTTGLEFKLFDPLQEEHHDFYAELPIKIVVEGDYHQFGNFVTRIAALQRIVTLHDVSIELSKNDRKSNKSKSNVGDISSARHLVMAMTAKTYRYAEDNNEPDDKKIKKPKK